jgi:hypothetical protein
MPMNEILDTYAPDDARSQARLADLGNVLEKPLNYQPPGQGPVAFKSWVSSVLASFGPNPNVMGDRALKFIPPLALFNDASQWVDTLFFNRPMTIQQTPDSNPPLKAQYFTPPPLSAARMAAGLPNIQMQLGMLDIQAARLTDDASNYFGG